MSTGSDIFDNVSSAETPLQELKEISTIQEFFWYNEKLSTFNTTPMTRPIILLLCLFIAFVPTGKADERSPWTIYGTVRDEEGKPMNDVSVHAAFFTGRTDGDGNYTIHVDPQNMPQHVRENETLLAPTDNNFHFLPSALSTIRRVFNTQDRTEQWHRDKSRTRNGDVVLVGDLAKPEDIDKLKQAFAEEQFDVIFVAKDIPLRVDFVMDSQPGPSPSFWFNREEEDRRNELYQKLGFKRARQETEQSVKVSASLRFPKAEIMLGEPMHFEYIVRNDSDVDFILTFGGDYRGTGRPITFNMRAVRTDSDTQQIIQQIDVPAWAWMGGKTGGARVAANGGEYVFDLFLPSWLEFTEPGEYRIDVARNLVPWRFDRDTPPDERLPAILRIASGTLTVKPFDDAAFGKLIDEWGQLATAPWNNFTGIAVSNLCYINDTRAIPWLLRLAERSNSSVLSTLTKYNDDAALAAIARNITSSNTHLSHGAASNLSRSVHPEAIHILFEHRNHPHYIVRRVAMQAAPRMEREAALQMLRERFDDPGGGSGGHHIDIAEEARRMYARLTEDDTE